MKEPPLPACRVSDDPPFSNTGIDFAGPPYVKDDYKQKTYICLYTCASTRAIHLELTEDLSVESFLLLFRHFTSCRGLPARLLSDNAKTFKAVAKEVKLITRSNEVQQYMSTKGVIWQFIIERAP
jgi:imidazoleglycerol phosphate dehydratase HisB